MSLHHHTPGLNTYPPRLESRIFETQTGQARLMAEIGKQVRRHRPHIEAPPGVEPSQGGRLTGLLTVKVGPSSVMAIRPETRFGCRR